MGKNGKRKVQGVPQSQTAALPRHQEEEETDKSKQAQIEQTYEKHWLALSSPSEVISEVISEEVSLWYLKNLMETDFQMGQILSHSLRYGMYGFLILKFL